MKNYSIFNIHYYFPSVSDRWFNSEAQKRFAWGIIQLRRSSLPCSYEHRSCSGA